MSFLYRVAGRGTALLAAARAGDRVACLAPLGVPFPAPTPGLAGAAARRRRGRAAVARVVGAAPSSRRSRLLRRPRRRRRALGTARGLAREHRHAPAACRPAARRTRDWSPICARRTSRAPAWRGPYQVLACGPTPMLRAAATWPRERGWPCLVSVEEHMGCGYGVCKGCVVPVRSGDDAVRNAMSCEEGPVFDAATLAWDRFQQRPPVARRQGARLMRLPAWFTLDPVRAGADRPARTARPDLDRLGVLRLRTERTRHRQRGPRDSLRGNRRRGDQDRHAAAAARQPDAAAGGAELRRHQQHRPRERGLRGVRGRGAARTGGARRADGGQPRGDAPGGVRPRCAATSTARDAVARTSTAWS